MPEGTPPEGSPEGDGHFTEGLEGFEESEITALKRYKTGPDAHRALITAQKTLSDPYRLPESLDKLTPEHKEAFQSSLHKLAGVPDKPEGYEFKHDLPEGAEVDSRLEEAFRAWAHEQKLSPRLAQEGINFWNKTMLATKKASAEAQEKATKETADTATKELTDLWGGEQGFKLNSELIKRLFLNHGGKDGAAATEEETATIRDAIDKTFGNNTIIAPIIARLATKLGVEVPVIEGAPTKLQPAKKSKWQTEFPASGESINDTTGAQRK